MSAAVKIGQVARETGLSIDTIRFYERGGLLRRSARTEGGFRLFGPREIQALRFIRKCQELGFSLDEIRELLILRSEEIPACSHVKELLEHKLAHVVKKIEELLTLQHSLRVALRKCDRGLKTSSKTHEGCCPVLEPRGGGAGEVEAMRIEVLYFDGCPNHKPTVERVREVLHQECISAEVSEVHIRDDAAAQAAGFLGSPSIRVNALDMEPAARPLREFGLMCRTYAEGNRRVGVPPRELIRTALREAAGAQRAHDCCQVPAVPTRLSEPAAPKRKWLLGGSVAAAVAASLCCILPILTAVTGVGVLAAGAKFESWRPYLLGVTGLLLGTGLFLAYRDYKKACAPGSLCATKPMSRWNLAALGLLAVLVAGLAAFPYYSGAVAQTVVGNPVPRIAAGSAALATVTFQIPDMDCPSCAVSLAATFKRLPGVAEAKLDVESRKAVVAFDPASQSVPSLEKVISESGFHVASKSVL